MGLFLTLLYVTVYYMSAPELFPSLAAFRPQLVTAILATAATVLMLPVNGYPVKLPQNPLIVGLLLAAIISRVVQLWFGGALMVVFELGATLIVFSLIAANVTSLARIKITMLVLIAVALYYAFVGSLAMNGMGSDKFLLEQPTQTGEVTYRMRGLGNVNDPNDMAQVFLIAVALLGGFWTKKTRLRNLLLILPSMALLLYGISLTRSRGAMLTLVLIVLVWKARKTNVVLAGVMAAASLVALVAVNFTGRDVVRDDGRLMAWSAAITMFKSHPLFGVGFNAFLENHDLTTHNSYLLCLAELGTLGFFCWMGLMVVTLLYVNQLVNKSARFPQLAEELRLALSLRLALIAFLASSWFLSRTYTLSAYLLAGLIAVLSYLTERRCPQAAFEWPVFRRWGWLTLVSQSVALVLAYLMIQVRII